MCLFIVSFFFNVCVFLCEVEEGWFMLMGICRLLQPSLVLSLMLINGGMYRRMDTKASKPYYAFSIADYIFIRLIIIIPTRLLLHFTLHRDRTDVKPIARCTFSRSLSLSLSRFSFHNHKQHYGRYFVLEEN